MTTQTQPQNQIQNQPKSPLAILKQLLSKDEVKARLEEMLGKRAGAFCNSIINVYRSNQQLQKCDPASVISSAMIAATLNLPIDPALGQAAIVPYKNNAQFQIMYRGLTQLCIRSGQYATIHCTEVYKDELHFWNPITGEIKFTDPATWKMRYSEKGENVVGHYARFKLLSGFEKSDFMTCEEAIAHAKKYSKSYQYDLRDNKQTSKWSTDPVPMGNKTILVRLLSKYGIMSIEMQDALVADSVDTTFEQEQESAAETISNQVGSEVVEAEFEPQGQPEPEPAQSDFLSDEGLK